MSKSSKRFLVTLIVFAGFLAGFFYTADHDTELAGGIGALAIFALFPLFIVALVWSIRGAVKDKKLKNAGIPVDNRLMPGFHNAVKAVKDDYEEGKNLSPELKKRRIKFRAIGWPLVLLAAGCYVAAFNVYLIYPMTFLGTMLLIAGLTLVLMSSPGRYNKSVDGVRMLICGSDYTLDRIYEDFKEYKTAYGSVYRGTALGKYPALFWGGINQDELAYIYKTGDEGFVYLGFGLYGVGCEQISDPIYPDTAVEADNLADAVCFNMRSVNFAEDLSRVLENYFKTGFIEDMPEYGRGNVYFFEEEFKLTGQKFELYNADSEAVLRAEGTYPLKTICIFDKDDNEIFKVSKEVVNALPHYLFYKKGELLGEFAQEANVVRDSFSMQTKQGLLEMRQINTLIGDNYCVTIDGKRIGNIAERLNLTLENLVFDNMVITVFDDKDLPLVTALGVMAAREMQRDRDGIA